MDLQPLPEDVEHVALADGEVFVLADPKAAASGLRLNAAGVDIGFAALDENAPGVGHITNLRAFPFDAGQVVAQATGDDGDTRPIAGHIDRLEEWSLEGCRTVQLAIDEPERAADIGLDTAIRLAPHDAPLNFEALLAIHRGHADLRLHLRCEETGRERIETVPFDVTKTGGRKARAYQPVRIPIPPSTRPETASLSVRYRGPSASSSGAKPHIFIAGARIVSADQTERPTLPLSLSGRPLADAEWFRTRFPVSEIGPGDQIRLNSPKGEALLFEGQRNAVVLEDQQGATLLFHAEEPGTFAIWLDGAPAFVAEIGSKTTAIALPARYLTGQIYHLSVRDRSGSQTLMQTYIPAPRIATPLDVLQRESKPPFPGEVFAQAAHRYQSLKAHLAEPEAAPDRAQLATALRALEAGAENARLDPLTFPAVKTPDVSVIIPAHDNVALTYLCLCSLLLAHNRSSFEVVLVDDASTDETAMIEEIVSGITVLRNTEPQRFLRACNAGAEKARGRYLAFLNNDTEVTSGWLDELVAAFERFEATGLAGSKLLRPDGRLQDAGGIVWSSGNPWNYGHDENPWDPRFSYARQVDYLSGAALMTSREIWDEVGGLSDYLAPMYFEDTDLAFKVREKGYRTYFIPSSVVYHAEGSTSGTDTSTGFKRYQEANRPKFKSRWARAFTGLGREGVTPDLVKDRNIAGRVLFIDHELPRPDRDAGSYAAVQEIRLVQALGFKVTFLPENLAYLAGYTEALQRDGIETIYCPFARSVGEFLSERAAEFDAFYITRYNVAESVIPTLRELAPHARIIFNNADLHFLRHLRSGLALGDADKVAEAELIRDRELSVMRAADLVLSYTDVEHSVIQSHTSGGVKVMRCPWVVNLPAEVAPLDARRGLAFLGGYRHHPNVEAVRWFAEEVMPGLESAVPGITLTLYGSGMPDDVRELRSESIDPVGFVADVAEVYDRHRLFVAPLRAGAGIKGKVIDALAHGIPCVITPVAAEGIGLRHGHDCLIAESPEDWQEAVRRLCEDDALWAELSRNGRSHAAEAFSFDKGVEDMRAAFAAVDLFGW